MDFDPDSLAILMAYRHSQIRYAQFEESIKLLFNLDKNNPIRGAVDESITECDVTADSSILLHNLIGLAMLIVFKTEEVKFFDPTNERFIIPNIRNILKGIDLHSSSLEDLLIRILETLRELQQHEKNIANLNWTVHDFNYKTREVPPVREELHEFKILFNQRLVSAIRNGIEEEMYCLREEFVRLKSQVGNFFPIFENLTENRCDPILRIASTQHSSRYTFQIRQEVIDETASNGRSLDVREEQKEFDLLPITTERQPRLVINVSSIYNEEVPKEDSSDYFKGSGPIKRRNANARDELSLKKSKRTIDNDEIAESTEDCRVISQGLSHFIPLDPHSVSSNFLTRSDFEIHSNSASTRSTPSSFDEHIDSATLSDANFSDRESENDYEYEEEMEILNEEEGMEWEQTSQLSDIEEKVMADNRKAFSTATNDVVMKSADLAASNRRITLERAARKVGPYKFEPKFDDRELVDDKKRWKRSTRKFDHFCCWVMDTARRNQRKYVYNGQSKIPGAGGGLLLRPDKKAPPFTIVAFYDGFYGSLEELEKGNESDAYFIIVNGVGYDGDPEKYPGQEGMASLTNHSRRKFNCVMKRFEGEEGCKNNCKKIGFYLETIEQLERDVELTWNYGSSYSNVCKKKEGGKNCGKCDRCVKYIFLKD